MHLLKRFHGEGLPLKSHNPHGHVDQSHVAAGTWATGRLAQIGNYRHPAGAFQIVHLDRNSRAVGSRAMPVPHAYARTYPCALTPPVAPLPTSIYPFPKSICPFPPPPSTGICPFPTSIYPFPSPPLAIVARLIMHLHHRPSSLHAQLRSQGSSARLDICTNATIKSATPAYDRESSKTMSRTIDSVKFTRTAGDTRTRTAALEKGHNVIRVSDGCASPRSVRC